MGAARTLHRTRRQDRHPLAQLHGRVRSLYDRGLIIVALLGAWAASSLALAQASSAELARQAEALASESSAERVDAIAALRALPEDALPAIRQRLVELRRSRPTLDEANAALTAFRRATGSRRADDLVDLAEGVAPVLDTTRTRSLVRVAEPLLLLRSIEAIGTEEALRLIPEVLRLDGPAWRMEGRRVNHRLGDRVLAAALRARADVDNPEGRAWARASTEMFGLDSPGTVVQRLDSSTLPGVLRAWGDTRTLDALPVIAAFIDDDRRSVREGARAAFAAMGQNGVWALREAFRVRLGRDADPAWGWQRTLRELTSALDARRAEHVARGLGEAASALDRGDPDRAQELLAMALLAHPQLAGDEAADLAVRIADRYVEAQPDAALALFRRAIAIAPDSTSAARARAESLHLEGLALWRQGTLDVQAFTEAAAEPSCVRCAATLRTLEPHLAPRTRRDRTWLYGAVAALFALLGLVLLGGDGRPRASAASA